MVLLLRDKQGIWDLPGGRIDATEVHAPFPTIIHREIKEELGEQVLYTLKQPILHVTRHIAGQKEPVLLVVFEAEYLSGSIILSPEHKQYEWINPATHSFIEQDFFSREEYLLFTSYFSRLVT